MNYSTAIFLISDDVRAIAVTYEASENAGTTLFKSLDPSLAVDDFVVVPTNTRHKMTVCKVKEVDVEIDLETPTEMDWIVGRVDRVNFEDIQAQESDAIAKIKSAEKRRKREELRKALLADAGEELKAIPIFTGEPAAEEEA